MQIQALAAGNWRNWKEVSLSPTGSWNLLTGQNGSGKTAILETMWALNRQRTARGQSLRLISRRGAGGHGWTRIHFSDQQGDHVLQLELGDSLVYRLDGDSVSAACASCHFPVVLLQPSDIALVTGDPTGRRELLLRAAFQNDEKILKDYKQFQSSLQQRNQLIKLIRDGQQNITQLDAWDAVFLPHALTVESAMNEVWSKLLPKVVSLLAELFPGIIMGAELRLSLLADWYPETADSSIDAYAARRLCEVRSQELQRGYSLRGPHRVDFVISFAGAPARDVGSQGQLRAIAIALRLAAAQYMAESRGETPILLMDDMAGEIDNQRSAGLLAWLQHQPCQVWLTATDPRHFPPLLMEAGTQHWLTGEGTLTQQK